MRPTQMRQFGGQRFANAAVIINLVASLCLPFCNNLIIEMLELSKDL